MEIAAAEARPQAHVQHGVGNEARRGAGIIGEYLVDVRRKDGVEGAFDREEGPRPGRRGERDVGGDPAARLMAAWLEHEEEHRHVACRPGQHAEDAPRQQGPATEKQLEERQPETAGGGESAREPRQDPPDGRRSGAPGPNEQGEAPEQCGTPIHGKVARPDREHELDAQGGRGAGAQQHAACPRRLSHPGP